jgi:uncharacterized protein (TIGR02996 family)
MLEALLNAVVAESQAEDRWLVLADWLDEHDDPLRAELLRLHRQLLATCCEPERHPERAGWQDRVVELLARGVRPCLPQRKVVLAEGVEMTFNFIPPGSFLMGSPPDEEGWGREGVLPGGCKLQHPATLRRGFWLGTHPVTQGQWHAVLGHNPSKFRGRDLPVEQVSWGDCQGFCTGLGQRCRLPSEAEWEWACRAGTTTPFHFGETISTDQANYYGRYVYGKGRKGALRYQTTPVGSFPPNAWGLYDLHGNVWEWCQGWYGRDGEEGPQAPQGEGVRGACVLRGGSLCYGPGECRSAYRDREPAGSRFLDVGCRVCLCPE